MLRRLDAKIAVQRMLSFVYMNFLPVQLGFLVPIGTEAAISAKKYDLKNLKHG